VCQGLWPSSLCVRINFYGENTGLHVLMLVFRQVKPYFNISVLIFFFLNFYM